MITKIALKNLMSHKETVLELGPGLTVVTGPNNCGKSALVTALQVVCRNHLGDLVVRHGEKEATVTIWTDDPHEITWRRKGKDVSYVIDGVEYSRLKGKPPEMLHELLKLPEIEEGDESFDLHFAPQKEPIFLLNDAGSRAAKFFAASSDAARLMAMQALHKRRTTERKSTLKTLRLQQERLQSQHERLQAIDPLQEELRRAHEAHEALATTLGHQAALDLTTERVLRQACDVEYQSQRSALLAALPDLPQLKQTDDLEEWLLEARRTGEQVSYQSQRVEACAPLASPPALVDESSLSDVVKHLEQAQAASERALEQTRLFARLPVTFCQTDEKPIRELLTKMQTAEDGLAVTVKGLLETQEAEEKAHRQLKRWMKQHPECPVCHRPWEEALLAVGGHAHG